LILSGKNVRCADIARGLKIDAQQCALQNPWFCPAKCRILGGKMQGFGVQNAGFCKAKDMRLIYN
jgi:hypothetical protein